MTKNSDDRAPLAYDIKGLMKATGRKRSSIYKAIASGHLIVRKAGRSTVILRSDVESWLQNLPVFKPSGCASCCEAAA